MPRFRFGLLLSVGAYTTWGITPLYWKLIREVPSLEITLHRIVWSFVFLFLVLAARKKSTGLFALLKQPRTRNLLFLNAALIGVNWFIYVYAINANHVVEASLGYFINPLISVFFGIFILKERPSRWQVLALGFALLGVSILTFKAGSFPWIAMSLAVTFACYGLIRKQMHADSLAANTAEGMILFPLAMILLGGKSAFDYAAGTQALLLFSGAVSAVPLLLFTESTKHLRLSTVGFLQYISPSLQFLLGVFVFREPFGLEQGLAFSLIWCGLAIYTFDLLAKQNSRSYT